MSSDSGSHGPRYGTRQQRIVSSRRLPRQEAGWSGGVAFPAVGGTVTAGRNLRFTRRAPRWRSGLVRLARRQPAGQLGQHLAGRLAAPAEVGAADDAGGVEQDELGRVLDGVTDAQAAAAEDREGQLHLGVLLAD